MDTLNFEFNEKHEQRLYFLLGFLFPPSSDEDHRINQSQVDFIFEFFEAVRDGIDKQKWPSMEDLLQEVSLDSFFEDLATIPYLEIPDLPCNLPK
ncbi:MAG: hypothetical protein HQM12_18085 [SAR324 cluster bacterium]|nr:hypothetical protein [SAR324 cluster bacterium]